MSQISTPDIVKMIREGSQSRLANFLNLPKVTVEEAEKADLVYCPWMVLIMVSGPLIQICLKIHFKIEHVKAMASNLYGISSDQMTDDQALDFVRELSNLIASAAKAELGNVGITTEVSLPVGTRGWEEFFFALEEQASVSDCWRLVVSNGKLDLSANIERVTTAW